ncbi:MAG: 50S ribosomal protein L25 [Acidimicrobiales bacterium]
MSQTVVTASTGRELGSRPSRRLRAEGLLPGVVYGLNKDPVTVTVEYTALRDALKVDSGMNTVLQLELDTGVSETVIVRSVQRDPIKRVVTHADFLRIDADQRIRVRVPLRVIGDDSTVTDAGGVVEQQLFELEVEVSPMNIPDEIEVDITGLTLDDRISIGDLRLPPGVTAIAAEEISVVSPTLTRAAKMVGEDGEGGEETGGDAEDAGDDETAAEASDADSGDDASDGGDE